MKIWTRQKALEISREAKDDRLYKRSGGLVVLMGVVGAIKCV